MTHWILETLYYDIRTFNGIRNRMLCCHRFGRADTPGVWLVSGDIHLKRDDTFETSLRSIGMDEYTERLNRMHCYSLAIHGP